MEKSTIIQISELEIDELSSQFISFEKLCVNIIDREPLLSYDLFKENGRNLTGVGPVKMIEILKTNDIKIYNYEKSLREIVEEDFAGFYMFYKNGEPEYCGISRNVLKRISDHTKGDKQSATFAHRLLMNELWINNMKIDDVDEKQKLKGYKDDILSYEFKLLKFYIPCPDTHNRHTLSTEHKEEILMYLFEVFASVYYKTIHNSFRTH